jgi:hypothetical protein
VCIDQTGDRLCVVLRRHSHDEVAHGGTNSSSVSANSQRMPAPQSTSAP